MPRCPGSAPAARPTGAFRVVSGSAPGQPHSGITMTESSHYFGRDGETRRRREPYGSRHGVVVPSGGRGGAARFQAKASGGVMVCFRRKLLSHGSGSEQSSAQA
jgi:hypothetical protein